MLEKSQHPPRPDGLAETPLVRYTLGQMLFHVSCIEKLDFIMTLSVALIHTINILTVVLGLSFILIALHSHLICNLFPLFIEKFIQYMRHTRQQILLSLTPILSHMGILSTGQWLYHQPFLIIETLVI